jgi:hypothetical protein
VKAAEQMTRNGTSQSRAVSVQPSMFFSVRTHVCTHGAPTVVL